MEVLCKKCPNGCDLYLQPQPNKYNLGKEVIRKEHNQTKNNQQLQHNAKITSTEQPERMQVRFHSLWGKLKK
jgi:hypothetical protein